MRATTRTEVQQPPVYHVGKREAGAATPARLEALVKQLGQLPPMSKRVMGGPCVPQTDRMVAFLRAAFGFHNTAGHFVNGVRAFELEKDLQTAPGDEVYTFEDRGRRFRMSAAEVRKWQQSFRVFYADDVYKGEEGRELLQKTLSGGSKAGEQAFKVKFAARISQNPILCTFSADVIPREVGDEAMGRIMLVSMSGVDFAGRHHDVDDIRRFIRNWRDVCVHQRLGVVSVAGCNTERCGAR